MLEALCRVPLAPSHDGKGDQEKYDSDDTGDVRHHGDQTGNVAGVGPDEADDRSHDEHGDHCSEPVQNPSSGDDAEPTSMGAFRQSFRQPSASESRPRPSGPHVRKDIWRGGVAALSPNGHSSRAVFGAPSRLVPRFACMQKVVGSNPIIRSTESPAQGRGSLLPRSCRFSAQEAESRRSSCPGAAEWAAERRGAAG